MAAWIFRRRIYALMMAGAALTAATAVPSALAAITPYTQQEQDAARAERLKQQRSEQQSAFSRIEPGSSSQQSAKHSGSAAALSPGAFFASAENLRKACVLYAGLQEGTGRLPVSMTILGQRRGIAAVQVLGAPKSLSAAVNGISLTPYFLGEQEIVCSGSRAGAIRFYDLKPLKLDAGVLQVRADGSSAQLSFTLQ
ncbi:MAG: hypothetical protein IAB19_00580 [Proteobacteria bacterium]|uniref:Uncharacterized protein n=1 Tax=Candidatus Avisuccinivibrio stercorigallinarum TaxID=2840704 RepID=A0A9D9GT75_9GAMM|nr:hypothetical protein [Candidatus Avisuccinivibrio stercorigallinarum]